MTCIVGLVKNKKVYIGGDSAGIDGYNIQTRIDTKVFKRKNMVFGCSISFRMIQLLRYSLVIPEYKPSKKELYEYMCTDFIDAVRQCLKNYGFSNINNNNESIDGNFIVGIEGRLFEIASDYQVGEYSSMYALGCGSDFAMGNMYSKFNLEESPQKIITDSLECAQYFSAGVRGPFIIEYV